MEEKNIHSLLAKMSPITLDEMSSIRLMNRIDTKFVTSTDKLEQLLAMTEGKYFVQDINGKRVSPYRTIYWDTPEHKFYFDHHNGHYPRKKVRVRTYEDCNLSFLEVKSKNNHGRTVKTRMQVPSPDTMLDVDADPFLKEKSGYYLEELEPTLENCFNRITLVNEQKTERVTIDMNIKYFNPYTCVSYDTGELVVIELKRDGNAYSPLKDMLRELRILGSGYSKYCSGMVMTDHRIKQNMFKKKLVQLNKVSSLSHRIKPVAGVNIDGSYTAFINRMII